MNKCKDKTWMCEQVCMYIHTHLSKPSLCKLKWYGKMEYTFPSVLNSWYSVNISQIELPIVKSS